MKRHQLTQKIFTYTFLSIAGLLVAFPALIVILGAFSTTTRFGLGVVIPIPNSFDLRIFIRIFEEGIGQAYIVTGSRVAFYLFINLLTGIIGGYVFSKLRFPGRNRLFLLFLSGMVIPPILLLLPDFILMVRLPLAGGNNILGQGGHGFFNEWPALILFGWVSPFAIFLLKQTYDMIPTEYEEAAKMDGAGVFSVIFRVYLPLLKPAIAAFVIITAVSVWNDFLWPAQAVISRTDLYPIAVRIKDIGGGYPSPYLMALIFMVFLPPTVLYLCLQRYFVQGMLATGLKG